MIRTKTRTTYILECDGCGAWIEAISRDELHEMAKEEGWVRVEWHNGIDLISRDYCPMCQEKEDLVCTG